MWFPALDLIEIPPGPTGTTAYTARVWPGASVFNTDTVGVDPPAATPNQSEPKDAVVVKVIATATASVGVPGRATVTTEPGAGREVSRESNSRAGVTGL